MRCFLEVMPVFVRLWGKKSRNYGGLLYGIAEAHRNLGQFADAKKYLLKRLAIVQAIDGKGHQYGSVLQELGTLEFSAKEYKNALAYFEKAVELEDKETNDFAVLLSDLALTLVELDDWRRALDLRLQQVALIRVLKTDTHPEYAAALHNAASLYLRLKNYPMALSVEKDAVAIFTTRFGEMDERTIAAQTQLKRIIKLNSE